jgi:hypothetical protein
MELFMGFSITAFIVIVAVDTIQQRRQNRKVFTCKRKD